MIVLSWREKRSKCWWRSIRRRHSFMIPCGFDRMDMDPIDQLLVDEDMHESE